MKIAAIVVSIVFIITIIVIIVGAVVSRKFHDVKSSEKMKAKYGCKSFSRPATILVYIDGFKADYLKRSDFCPNISKLATNGVQAEMKCQFPTKVFPNIFSILTGLYPESHGIVSNSFLNQNRTEKYSPFGKGEKTDWFQAEPIWLAARKKKVKSAMYYLLESNAGKERKPDYGNLWDGGKASYEKIVDQALTWLGMDASKRPYFISLYFEEINAKGHRYGPDSQETNWAIKKVDDAIGRLMKGIEDQNLLQCVNIILVSDHGMVNVSCSQVMYLDQMISLANVTTAETGPFMFLYTKNKDDAKNITDQLKCKNKNLEAYSRHGGSIPKRLHFSNNKRIGDVILIPKVGWRIFPTTQTCPNNTRGEHGYDNLSPEMLALFVANGPSFRKGIMAPQFSSIEVYNLLTEILRIPPAPNNGTYGSLAHMLKGHVSPIRPANKGHESSFSKDCLFPRNLSNALNDCKYCTCPYCAYEVLNNLTMYRKSLDLSKEEIQDSLKTHFPWGTPEGGAGKQGCLLTQKHYAIGYSGYLHIPLWVGYKLTAKQLLVNIPRKNCFRRDIRLKSEHSSFCADYSRSGYDRGHLAPSADFNFERVAEQDTFILSNIAPQSKYFNRSPGLWFKSETLFRTWAIEYDPVYVISGSIFDANGDGLRDNDTEVTSWVKGVANGVAIPTHFYKIIVRCNETAEAVATVPGCKGKLEALSFVFPHNHEKDCKLFDWTVRLLKYTASINDIEKLTGSEFFPGLPYPFSASFKSSLPSQLWPSASLV